MTKDFLGFVWMEYNVKNRQKKQTLISHDTFGILCFIHLRFYLYICMSCTLYIVLIGIKEHV